MARLVGSERDATDRLAQWRYLSQNQRGEIAHQAHIWPASEIDLVLAHGLAPAEAVARALADVAELPLIARGALPFDRRFAKRAELAFFVKERCLPWRDDEGTAVFAVVNPYTAQAAIEAVLGPDVPFRMAVATKVELTTAMMDAFADGIAKEATDSLSRSFPDQSARGGIPLRQGLWLALILAGITGAFVLAPHASFVTASLLSGAYFMAVMAFRLVLMAASFGVRDVGPKCRPQRPLRPGRTHHSIPFWFPYATKLGSYLIP